MITFAPMQKTSAAAGRKRKSRWNGTVKYMTDVYEAFLSNSENVSPANQLAPGPSAWIPDGMELAKLAAMLFPDCCKGDHVESALHSAWAVFVRSQAFCLELKALSPEKRAARLDNIPVPRRSAQPDDTGAGWFPSYVKHLVGKMDGPTRTYRFDPASAAQDDVRLFLGVKDSRTVLDILDRYCIARTPDDEPCDHRPLLDAAKRTDDNGKEVYDFPEALMYDIRQHREDLKRVGGRTAWEKRRLSKERDGQAQLSK